MLVGGATAWTAARPPGGPAPAGSAHPDAAVPDGVPASDDIVGRSSSTTSELGHRPTDDPSDGPGAAEMLGVGAGQRTRRPDPRTTVVIYVPHQDDELLSMGILIAGHVTAGDDIEIVLLTDGSASSARSLVDGRLARLGLPPLSVGDFVAARDREFLAGLAALGIPASHVHRVGRMDGMLTGAEVRTTVERMASSFPGALHITTSLADRHSDHRAAAQGLAEARVGGSRAWAVARPSWPAGPAPVGCVFLADPSAGASLARAAAEYRAWDPSSGRYGIAGLYRVPRLVEAAVDDPRDLVCADPRA